MLRYGDLSDSKFYVETDYYYLVFDRKRGGTLIEYRVKKAKNTNVIFREGIEMYWAYPPKGDPNTWPQRHFEQEEGGKANLKVFEEKRDNLVLEVSSRCGWTLSPAKLYGKTLTYWHFWPHQPYVYVEFEEDHQHQAPDGTELWFKRYTCSPGGLFTHYAKEMDSWAMQNLSIIPNIEKYLQDNIYIRGPIEVQQEGDPPRYPAAKWLSLYNYYVGFAVLAPVLEFWRGDHYPETSRSGVFHSNLMDELIYYARMPNQRWRMNLIYYGYPVPLPFQNVVSTQYHSLSVGNSLRSFTKEEEPLLYFDDCLLNTYTVAFPIMRRYNMQGIVGAISSKIGQTTRIAGQDLPCMTLKQLKKLLRNGWEVAGHSATHPQLDTAGKYFFELSLQETEYEVKESKRWIEENLGVTPKRFIVPEHLARDDQRELILKYYQTIREYPVSRGHFVFHEIKNTEEFERLVQEIASRRTMQLPELLGEKQ